MNQVSQFLLNTRKRLTFDSNEVYVNTDNFNAHPKFNDLWNDAQTEIVEKYNLPSFHLWEDGFSQGDASNDEVFEAVKSINEVEYKNGSNESNMGNAFAPSVSAEYNDIDEDVIETDVYSFLDSKLLDILEPKVEKLVSEFQEWIKSQSNS